MDRPKPGTACVDCGSLIREDQGFVKSESFFGDAIEFRHMPNECPPTTRQPDPRG